MKIGENNRVRAPKSPDVQLCSTPIHLFRPCVQHPQIWRVAPKVQGQMDAVEAMRCYPPSISGATSSSPGDRRFLEGNDRTRIQHPTSNIQHPTPSTQQLAPMIQWPACRSAWGRAPPGSPWRANPCARMCDRRRSAMRWDVWMMEGRVAGRREGVGR